MFDGFTQTRIETSSAAINLMKGGGGPPLSCSTATRRPT